jgi:uncharacterized membrane protein YczE
MAIVGYLIDFWNAIHLEEITSRILGSYSLLVTGLVLDAYASALIILSDIGIRIMDLVAITIVQKLNWPFIGAKCCSRLHLSQSVGS